MLPELGFFFLLLATSGAFFLALLPQLGLYKKSPTLIHSAWWLSYLLALSGTASVALLAYAFATDDFTLEYVAAHSNSQLPLFFKVAATWGGHEGSMLFWLFSLSLWLAAFAFFNRKHDRTFSAQTLSLLGLICFGFALFILFYSNPFGRIFPPPQEGRDLNPMLQDIGLIFHPPLLYIGYVGFAVNFAMSLAALIYPRSARQIARSMRCWVLSAWLFLTLGIVLGAWWAYYELGWGGWWFWDPVENASLMPWLIGTALLHSLIVSEKRGAFLTWTALLAILAFSLSLIGTFLVRSGVLTSVHAFAADPTRGIYILALLVAITLPAFILLIQRAPALASRAPYALLSRETGILANNWLMTGACLIVFTGTLYPLAADSLNLGKISVGAPYYNRLIVPLALASLILLGIGPLLRWKNDRARRLVPRLAAVLALALAATLLTLTLADTWQIRTALAVFAAMTAAAAIIVDTTDRLRHRLPITRAYSGMTLAHLGYLITALGITATSLYSNEQDHSLKRGSVLDFAGYRLTLVDLETREGPNYTATVGKILVQKTDGTPVTVLLPSKRNYHSSTMPMTESARHITPTHDLYLALGEAINADTWAVRLQYKPFILWIWLGALIMAAGAALAALPHRKTA